MHGGQREFLASRSSGIRFGPDFSKFFYNLGSQKARDTRESYFLVSGMLLAVFIGFDIYPRPVDRPFGVIWSSD